MSQTFLKETTNSGWGVLRLILGRRDAPEYFNLSLAGLAGSLIAFLFAVALNAYVPVIVAGSELMQPASQRVFMSLIIFSGQILMAAVALRQYGRLDGLVPYLVCDNWTTFFTTVFSLGLVLFNVDGGLSVLVLMVAAIIVAINIARLIVTLSPLQVAGFIVAQLVGVLISTMVISAIFPDILAMQQEILQSSIDASSAASAS